MTGQALSPGAAAGRLPPHASFGFRGPSEGMWAMWGARWGARDWDQVGCPASFSVLRVACCGAASASSTEDGPDLSAGARIPTGAQAKAFDTGLLILGAAPCPGVSCRVMLWACRAVSCRVV